MSPPPLTNSKKSLQEIGGFFIGSYTITTYHAPKIITSEKL